jgi:peptidoglycan hydrolase-like protein with peptidoglycan-binding domain
VSTPNPFGGVTMAQAVANLSAMSCPTAHGSAVPVETVDGELVAALCPDCDQQLPAAWAAAPKQPPALPPFVPDPQLTERSGA